VPLPRTEMRLLHFFMRHPGETLSKETLLHNVWDHLTISGDYNLVDTAIKRLRRHIEDDPRQPKYIITVWGVGFRLEGG
jgi:DNA-binding response OmpR family regulator